MVYAAIRHEQQRSEYGESNGKERSFHDLQYDYAVTRLHGW